MIVSKTPYRISFFGGGTDYPDWYLKHGGKVISTSIDKFCYITCRQLPPFFSHKHRIVYSIIENTRSVKKIKHPSVRAILERSKINHGLEIHHDGDLPARSGIGSSSSFTVGLLNVIYKLQGKTVNKIKLAKDAIFLEQKILKEAVGSQDQIAAAVGGFNLIKFKKNNSFEIKKNIFLIKNISTIENHILLCFSGLSRISSKIAKKKISNINSKKNIFNKLNYCTDIAEKMLKSNSFNIKDFAELISESWYTKKSLDKKVSNKKINEIFNFALNNGALGGKLLGAGAGGFLMFLVPPHKKKNFIKKMKKNICFEVKFEHNGSTLLNLKK